MYFRLTNKKETHNGFKYETGLNTDTVPFDNNPNHTCCKGGLYFSNEVHICSFINMESTYIREVTIPKNEKVVRFYDKCRVHSFILGKRRNLNNVETWKWLSENGVNLVGSNCFNNAIKCAAQKGYLEVVKYLHLQGVDIHTGNGHVLRLAAEEGHLEVVKYLIKHVYDPLHITYALESALFSDNLELIQYLVKKGADVTQIDISPSIPVKIAKYLKTKQKERIW